MLLESIWFFLWGLLWAIFFMTDGFDFGTGTLIPFLAKNEEEKRIMYNAIGPLWDGNEVWLITAGGVTFAAFPTVYAVMFSSLYTALMLILFALIFRGVSIEFRSNVENPKWRRFWDICFSVGSFLPALLFGVAFANIFKGLPIDETGRLHGNLLTLLNPYALLGGALFVVLFLMHGALWLAIKTDGDLQQRTVSTAHKLWPVVLAVTLVFLAASRVFTPLWDNYIAHPALLTVVLMAVAGLVGIKIFLVKQAYFKAWFSSAALIVGATFFGVVGLFPNLFPSTIDPAYSLSAHNAASSPLTLRIMLVVVIIFIPIVLAYQAWTYNLFKSRLTEEDLSYDDGY